MNVIINQFFGLGDILFIEPIYRHYHNRGFTVIAPILPEYLWIQEYIPYVQFKDKNVFRYRYEEVDQPKDGNMHVPLRFAHPLLRGYDLHYGDDRKHWMPDKYEYLGLPVELWKTLSFNRNLDREKRLVNLLNLPEKFNFVNNTYGGSFEKISITVPDDLPVIELRKIDGFTLLDWGGVIERAEKIFTVETSIIYYIESLATNAERHLYPRLPWLENVEYMSELLPNWIRHDKDSI